MRAYACVFVGGWVCLCLGWSMCMCLGGWVGTLPPCVLQSTGLTLWAAADQLAAFLHAHREVVADKAVVELGCGLGLVGILRASQPREPRPLLFVFR